MRIFAEKRTHVLPERCLCFVGNMRIFSRRRAQRFERGCVLPLCRYVGNDNMESESKVGMAPLYKGAGPGITLTGLRTLSG